MHRLIRFFALLLVAFLLISLFTWLDLGTMINLGGLLIILIVVITILLKKASKNS